MKELALKILALFTPQKLESDKKIILFISATYVYFILQHQSHGFKKYKSFSV